MLYVWLGALVIGLTLGLLGSGGSILTVPALVYLAGEPEKVAITESLAIVGGIALSGAVPYALQRSVDWRSVAFFGGPGLVGAYLGATLARFVPGPAQLVLFAVVMLAAAWTMYRGRREVEGGHPGQALWKTAALGLSVGTMTGLVGVGGGFLIVPALVLLVGLPMRVAVGTSLSIIVLNCLSGFLKYLDVLGATEGAVDWRLVGLFVAVGVVGTFVGNRVSRRVPQAALRRVFAVFLLVMAAFILWREVPQVLGAPEAAAAALSP